MVDATATTSSKLNASSQPGSGARRSAVRVYDRPLSADRPRHLTPVMWIGALVLLLAALIGGVLFAAGRSHAS